MPPIYCSLALWKSSNFCLLSYLKGRSLLLCILLPCYETCSLCAWLGPLQFFDNFLCWILPDILDCMLEWLFSSHETVAFMCSFWQHFSSFFPPPLFLALPILISFRMSSNTHSRVHSTSPAWSITITAIPWALLPRQFYIQLSILLSVPYLLTL